MEVWRDVVGFEETHEVSSLGRVRSKSRKIVRSNGRAMKIPGRVLTPVSSDGYMRVVLTRLDGSKSWRMVHTLVAEAFIGSRPVGFVICHGPRGQKDNSAVNLRYDTPKQNIAERKPFSESISPITDLEAAEIRARRAGGEQVKKLAEEFGLSISAVSLLCLGKTRKHMDVPLVAKGSKKLTTSDVIEIRVRRAAGEKLVDLARLFGVSHAQISKVAAHISFREIKEGPLTPLNSLRVQS